MSKVMKQLWDAATRLPDTEPGVACAGTPLERRTATVAKRAFLFLGLGGARLKLDRSLGAARAHATKAPEHVQVGANGWVKITFGAEAPAPAVLVAWIAESHALMSTGKKPAPKKQAAKKNAAPHARRGRSSATKKGAAPTRRAR
jgi:hypothetical protein